MKRFSLLVKLHEHFMSCKSVEDLTEYLLLADKPAPYSVALCYLRGYLVISIDSNALHR